MRSFDPALGLKLVIVGGWILAAIGGLKVLVYLVGEFAPGIYAGFRSDGMKRFLTGKGNRLVFGLGGLVTALLGLFFVLMGQLIAWLQQLVA